MNKDPESRYATAQDLANDLRCFLVHKPIRAKLPTIWEKAVKWGRRHPSIVASCLVTPTLTVIMLSATIVFVSWERKATNAALRLLVEQEQATRKSAEEARTLARWADENAEWVMQGITEPLKKLANPDFAKNPEFDATRRAG
jgi:eukaryotic-like serine/threonine-protein kinase